MGAGGAPVAGADAYNGRFTAQAFGACLVGASTGLLMGYENGIAGGVAAMPGWQRAFFPHIASSSAAAEASGTRQHAYCKYDDNMLQLFLSSIYLASVMGAIAGSLVTPRLGRRATMLGAAVCFTAGAALQGAAVHISMMVLGRVLLGLGMGAADQVGPQYISEMAPHYLRGRLASVFQLLIIIGFFISNIINYGTQVLDPNLGWRLSLGLAGVPALLLLGGALLLPDSPNSLAERGRHEEAVAVLRAIRGTSDVDAEMSDISAAAELSAGHRQWHALFSRRYRPQLVISIMIPVFQVLCGFQAVIFAAQLFESIGAGHVEALKFTVVIGVVFVLFTLIAVGLADHPRVGRIVLLQSSGALCCASMVALAALLATYANPARPSAAPPESLSTAVLAVICVYVAGFSFGWGPMGWLVPTEVTPLDARAASSATAVVANHLTCFILAQCFMSMLCAMTYGLLLFFAGWIVVATVFVQLLLPESKNVPLEEIYTTLFQSHWAWGRLCKQRDDDGRQAGGSQRGPAAKAAPADAKDAACKV